MRFILKILFQILIAFTLVFNTVAQPPQKLRVYFTDKQGVTFDPYSYFDSKTIENRLKQNLPLYDISDYPLSQTYIAHVGAIADSTGFASRWFNFAVVWVSSDKQINSLKHLPFVDRIEQVPQYPVIFAEIEVLDADDNDPDFLMKNQLERMGVPHFREEGINGKGIRIAVFDGGFPNVDKHEAFAHLRKEGRILKTWDFIKDKEDVYYGNSHGRATLACIAGIWEGQDMGMATGAEFLLAKTEIDREPFSEEENWLAAAEWADKNGVNIISSSLGYGYQRYFTSDMDGKSSLVVKAAQMAARKGILVVNSAGNEADSKWRGIITPADGDSVLAVGGIDPGSDYHIGFSSFGPTADKRLKPNVCAYGHVMSLSENGIKPADGTSFSCPLVSGFAACAWQKKPQLNNMELFREIEQSGHLYPYYDYAHGYGVPQAKYFTKSEEINIKRTFEFVDQGAYIIVRVNPEIYNDTAWLFNSNHLYYHFSDTDNYLSEYNIIYVMQKEVLKIPRKEGQILRVNFRSFTDEFKM